MRKWKKQFTLLELLVAVTIFLLLTTVVVASLSGIGNSWKRLSLENQKMQDLLSLDRTIHTMLSNVVDFSWRDHDDKRFVFFEGQADSVRLVYQHALGTFEEGGLRFVDLHVDDGNLLATYRNRPVEDLQSDFPDSSTSVLAEGVDHIKMSYADEDTVAGWQWLNEWDPENVHSNIPPAIAIEIFWRDGRWECWLRRTKYGVDAF